MTEANKDAVDAITDQWYAVRPDLDTVPMAVFGRINRIARAVSEEMERTYNRYGVSLGEFDVVATLRRSGAPYTLSPRQLSATLMLTSGGMTGRLDKLEKAGLLCRNPDPNDRRGLQVTITERGLKLIDEAVAAGLEVQRAALAGLDGEEVAALSGLLRKLMAGAP
ncbi:MULTISPECIES: MarR family winged helix-turn-helix transcriptional regulator [unclassified Streptomyces]|uniref:MarR family winged helix-turn-helix transcriptional regulator n=1 Tax=unclassified Streptomyces TaxID=2593676 RepID=UPI00109E56FD|nr:MarR family transcriptional regulator [Streptomyces sp. A1136]THA46240.1 MarR family transcriptional regulator [Streptomyces sp. A1136]